MNNNTTEDYCSFEVCKLLKERGCDLNNNGWYNQEGDLHGRIDVDSKGNEITFFTHGDNYKQHYQIAYKRYSHALAIKWIRENFNIYIWVDCDFEGNFYPQLSFCNKKQWHDDELRRKLHRSKKVFNIIEYKSPEEATEAVLLYTLNNLIKN